LAKKQKPRAEDGLAKKVAAAKTPADKLIACAHGVTNASRLLDVDRTWIWLWRQPRSKRGRDGKIPEKHHPKVMELAERFNWPLTAADIIGWTSKT
jgi:hypothetical protein